MKSKVDSFEAAALETIKAADREREANAPWNQETYIKRLKDHIGQVEAQRELWREKCFKLIRVADAALEVLVPFPADDAADNLRRALNQYYKSLGGEE